MGLLAIATYSIKHLLLPDAQPAFFLSGNKSSLKALPIMPLPSAQTFNLYILQPAANHDVVVFPARHTPHNLKGAELLSSRSSEEPGMLQVPGRRTKASYDWFNAAGEPGRNHLWIVREPDSLPSPWQNQQIMLSGRLFQAEPWQGTFLVFDSIKVSAPFRGREQQALAKKSRKAMQALLARILDMIAGDYVEIIFPGQCINGPAQISGAGELAVVYTRLPESSPSGASEVHLRNWLSVIGADGVKIRETPTTRQKRKASEKGTLKNIALPKSDRQIIAQARKNFLDVHPDKGAYLSRVRREAPDLAVYIFDPHTMPTGFSSPVLHGLLSHFYNTLSDLSAGKTPTAYIKNLDILDPLLFDTLAYMLHMAHNSPWRLNERERDYLTRVITHMEEVLDIKVPWQQRFESLKEDMKESLYRLPEFPQARTLPELHQAMLQELPEWRYVEASTIVPEGLDSEWFSLVLKAFAEELQRKDSGYWAKMQGEAVDLFATSNSMEEITYQQLGQIDKNYTVEDIRAKLSSRSTFATTIAEVFASQGADQLFTQTELADYFYHRVWLKRYVSKMDMHSQSLLGAYKWQHPDPMKPLMIRFVFRRALNGPVSLREQRLYQYLIQKISMASGFFNNPEAWIGFIDIELLPEEVIKSFQRTVLLLDLLLEEMEIDMGPEPELDETPMEVSGAPTGHSTELPLNPDGDSGFNSGDSQ